MRVHAYDNTMQLGPGRVSQTFVTVFPHVKMAGKKEMARTQCKWCTNCIYGRTTDKSSQRLTYQRSRSKMVFTAPIYCP